MCMVLYIQTFYKTMHSYSNRITGTCFLDSFVETEMNLYLKGEDTDNISFMCSNLRAFIVVDYVEICEVCRS